MASSAPTGTTPLSQPAGVGAGAGASAGQQGQPEGQTQAAAQGSSAPAGSASAQQQSQAGGASTASASASAPATATQAPPVDEAHRRTKELMTIVPESERSHLVETKTDEKVERVPVKVVETSHRHFLVALDPKAEFNQSKRVMETIKQLVKPDDVVILFSVLDPVSGYYTIYDPAFTPWALPYTDPERIALLAKLTQMRSKRARELRDLAREYLPGIRSYAHVVHGNADEEILDAAERHQSDIIVIGKRKLGRWEQLWYHSVSNYVSSHADCSVIIAK